MLSAYRQIAFALLFFGPLSFGPLSFGPLRAEEIRLSVTDPSGRPAQADGRLEGAEKRVFSVDPLGHATVSGLSPGHYRLELTRSGFAKRQIDLDLLPGASLNTAVTLTLSSSAFSIEVVAATPLAGGDLNRDQVPAPAQFLTVAEIERSSSPDLASLLNRQLSGVHINEIQGNPFQPDLNYRGYTASPLLGTPQGLSIYMDGVRLNQPFGDVVSWDLIPRTAILETTLIPGSNPLFGLNTLGGAIAIDTKSGLTSEGSALTLSGGSWGRKTAELEHGGRNSKGWNWYGAANLFFEDGWRTASPSNVRQFFGKLGWQGGKTGITLALSYANNSLSGNGLQEQRFLLASYSSVYTKPDITANRSPFLNLTVRHQVTPSLTFAGNVYYRFTRTRTLNSDVNENSLDQSVYQPNAADIRALAAAGYSGYPTRGANAGNTPFPFWRCIAQALQGDRPAEKCNALLNRGSTRQQNFGTAGQVTWTRGGNQLIGGAGFDRRTTGFRQLSQLGYLNPDRSITPVNAYGDGITGGTVNGEPFNTRVNLDGRANTESIYLSDTAHWRSRFTLTGAARFNRNTVRNLDNFIPELQPGSLSSRSVFQRVNPAAGFTYRPWHFLTAYVSFSEGSRAPTSVELGCADFTRPCKLPNALAGDPPLKQVTTQTVEAGFRGSSENGLGWSAGWFRAENRNDLLFAASAQTGFGYFKNFGKTRREGLEANLHGRWKTVDWGGGYTFLNATYQTPETLNAGSNSTASGGGISIVPGDRIPLVPRNTLKAFALWRATRRLGIDLDLNAIGRSFARGNENNQSQPDGIYYLGPGISPGYAVVNGGLHFELYRHAQLFVQVTNIAGRRYYSAAQLGPTAFSANGTFLARPFPAVGGDFPLERATFYAPGAPRGAWGGIRFSF